MPLTYKTSPLRLSIVIAFCCLTVVWMLWMEARGTPFYVWRKDVWSLGLGYGLTLLYLLSYNVTLYADALSFSYFFFGGRHIPRDDIDGIIMKKKAFGSGLLVVTLKDNPHKPVKIPLLFRPDEAFYAWLNDGGRFSGNPEL